MKNLRTGGYLPVAAAVSKEERCEDVAMQNVAAPKGTFKMKENSTNRNLKDSNVESVVRVKRLQDIIKERANTEDLLKTIVNQEVRGVPVGQLPGHSPVLFPAFF